MAENKEYYMQSLENGSIQISDEVVASAVAMAILEVDGVAGLNGSIGADIAEMLGKKSLAKGVRLSSGENDAICIDCDVVAKFGQSIIELAKNIQQSVIANVTSVTGLCVEQVNVNICGIALPKETKK